MDEKRKLRVGIIGLGIISEAHIEAISQMNDIATLAAVCDLNENRAQAVASRFGADVYTDYHKLLSEADLDMVDIILPHNLHYPVAMAALDQGMHVLLEKPITIDPAQGWELIERARTLGVKFSVAENTHFVTAYLEAEQLLRRGVLGDIYQIRTLIAGSEVNRLKDPHPWKAKKEGSGGGVLIDAAPHTFYLLKWLFGEIKHLQAFHSQLIEAAEVEDNALVIGEMVSGAGFVSQFTFTAESPWTERLEIYGTNGALIIDQIADPPAVLFHGEEDFYGTPMDSVPYDPVNWKYNSILDETKHFVRAVVEDTIPRVDPADAHYALLAIHKAYESARAGQRMIMKNAAN